MLLCPLGLCGSPIRQFGVLNFVTEIEPVTSPGLEPGTFGLGIQRSILLS